MAASLPGIAVFAIVNAVGVHADMKQSALSALLASLCSGLLLVYICRAFPEVLQGALFPPDHDVGGPHIADQRDVAAYVLGTLGLTHEARIIREWPRTWTYWAISDFLTHEWLSDPTADRQTWLNGRDALIAIVGYATMAKASEPLIEVNMARLAARAGMWDAARAHIASAQASADPVVTARLHHHRHELTSTVKLANTSPALS